MQAGDVLGERYRLVDLLARGGMGEVWRAVDERLGREVAVKVLHAAYAGDSAFHDRFRAEARNTAAFTHPGVAQVYDFGGSDASPWLVMELVPGQPLSALLDRGPIGVPATLDVLAQTARALQAAHAAGVVHRDVKPGNLLLTPDGVVKVTDFGIARAADALPLTATGTVMGSAPYLSPEQAHGRTATAASDVYALGVLAYECLAGHRPFIGETAVDVAAAHAADPPPPLPLTVPQPLKDLVLAMLAKDPADRPDDRAVAERAEALRGSTPGLAAGFPVEGATEVVLPLSDPAPTRSQPVRAATPAPQDALRPFTPPRRRRRLGPALLVAVVVLALAAAGAYALGSTLTGGSGSAVPHSSSRASRSASASASASTSASASATPSSTPEDSGAASQPAAGGALDPQTLVGQPDSAAFPALKAAGYSYKRLHKALDDAHPACSVASVEVTGRQAKVTVWWPAGGGATCAKL
ncbi:serine/threonine-protein kinase [Motilibacter rhizosphaerae]|uniref:non-specific serine/threonine protein kinase n=1 Tax=Motilibacter rhizosphaerae TaxID=598652 RepID=A0A4Q7NVS9_9ACTN|nr:serine/threonine-protein kinase [Motilibacter rhizosphaerae]RZS91254.1 serine/threonine-protein kinase [Motilibacter rhizosphaerae]